MASTPLCVVSVVLPVEWRRQRVSSAVFIWEKMMNQIEKVWNLMRDSKPRRLQYIAYATGEPTPSVSARLREFRKIKRGSHTVLKRKDEEGIYRYTVIPNGDLL